MIVDNLYQTILIDPIECGGDRLRIISGYATAAMSFRYMNHLRELGKNISVELTVGMTPRDGLSVTNHFGFKKLMEEDFNGRLTCSYLTQKPATHSKVYVWSRGNEPIMSFTGSANYTQNAFSMNSQREAMTKCDPFLALDYYQSFAQESIYCTHPEVEEEVAFYKDSQRQRVASTDDVEHAESIEYESLFSISVSLLDRNGSLPQRSGLNWGQRPEMKREPNQAYIRLSASIYRTGFFPPKSITFTVLTDDGKTLLCTRAQENGKAIHTPHNNSLIGEYFRNRLGLANGALVQLTDLQRYGRTDLTFHKIDDETFYMDFSV